MNNQGGERPDEEEDGRRGHGQRRQGINISLPQAQNIVLGNINENHFGNNDDIDEEVIQRHNSGTGSMDNNYGGVDGEQYGQGNDDYQGGDEILNQDFTDKLSGDANLLESINEPIQDSDQIDSKLYSLD